MDLNVEKEVGALRQMTVPQLREKYRDVFGHETRSRHKAFLIKRIVWRLQALAEGDLSERARRRAEELANDADLRPSPPKPKAAGDEPAGRTATATLHLPGDSRLPERAVGFLRRHARAAVSERLAGGGTDGAARALAQKARPLAAGSDPAAVGRGVFH